MIGFPSLYHDDSNSLLHGRVVIIAAGYAELLKLLMFVFVFFVGVQCGDEMQFNKQSANTKSDVLLTEKIVYERLK